ncbi:hypothetical protein [Komagataeibacter diospyri]|nr:hypothetical protein [Komagataeibacter diospyri]
MKYFTNKKVFLILLFTLFLFVVVFPFYAVTYVYPRSLDINSRLSMYGSCGTWATVILAAASIFFAWKSSYTNNQTAKDAHFLNIITSIAESSNNSIAAISDIGSNSGSKRVLNGDRVKFLLSSSVTVIIKGRQIMDKIFEGEVSHEKYKTYISIYISEEVKSEFKYKRLFNICKKMDELVSGGELSDDQKVWYNTLEKQYDDVSSDLY